jgi:CRISPR-associated endonuclease/helicase Cas3
MDKHTHVLDDQFAALTGFSPFQWQRRLFDDFVKGRVPDALDLPTGLGKTSVMAVWLIARAFAKKDASKAIPRRLIYVVDRRAVVDQATAEAEKLRTALEADASHLRKQLGLEGALPISTLRGAHVDNREWLNDPAVPAIVVGTVDMIGSRLLFEGYGVSRKMRPYHAGLLGADALIVLDEAHLVPPFEALLRRIEDGATEFGPSTDCHAGVVPPFKLLSLSATGRAQPTLNGGAAASVFRLEDGDLCDPIVKERLSAKKTLRLVKAADGNKALVQALTQYAWNLVGNSSKPLRCLVYCDSREVAESVKGSLCELAAPDKKGADPKADIELFVGARRIKEREEAKTWLEDHGFLAGSPPPMKPAFLVATSAGEVGIDLDADHMVCDPVPWERIVQRLGRVNRRGAGRATITVVHGDAPKPKKPDAPTDHEMRQTVGFRSLAVLEELPNTEDGRDASSGALRELKLRGETDKALSKKIDEATTLEPLHPALTRALVDAWSMTSLERHTGRPEVTPWLRGWVEDDHQTTVIWRTYLPRREGSADWAGTSAQKGEVEVFFEAAPPQESEKLEAETSRVAEWLQDRAGELLKHKTSNPDEETEGVLTVTPTTEAADAEQADAEPVALQAKSLRGNDIAAFVLSFDGSYVRRFTLDDLVEQRKGEARELFNALAEQVLVVDARFGGLLAGMLHPKADSGFATADTCNAWSKEAGFRVRRASRESYESKEDDWRFEDDFVLRSNGNGDPEEWLVVEHYKSAAQSEDARSVSRPQELAEHRSWAERKARDIARKVGLSGIAAEALALAAFLHDEGKRAMRWQRAFKASRDAKKYRLSSPLAKTRGPIDQQVLDGYRHEFGSLPYAESHARYQTLPQDWRDLVLHLIAAHHGQARPVIGTRGCEDAPPSALQERACAVALRFAKLQKRWGPWGLAWWEALLRAADSQASRDNDRRDDQLPSYTGGE